MVLNVESIFGSDEDELKDRWQQSGSTLINASGNENAVLHTVTAGKTLYVTQIILYGSAAVGAGEGISITDNAVSRVTMTFMTSTSGETINWYFPIPLKFTTNCKSNEVGNFTGTVYMIGWEE